LPPTSEVMTEVSLALSYQELLVVVTGQFIIFLLHNHFITDFFFKKKSGDVNDEANFSLFILLHKRAKPAPPPYPHPHTGTLYKLTTIPSRHTGRNPAPLELHYFPVTRFTHQNATYT